MADTIDRTAGTAASAVGGGVFRITNVVDLELTEAANVAAGNGVLATSDVIQALDIPANTYVTQVFTVIKEATSCTTFTATIGDASSAAGWGSAFNLEDAAGTVTAGVHADDAYNVLNGKLYSSADTIDLVVTVDYTAKVSLGKVAIVAMCFDPTYV